MNPGVPSTYFRPRESERPMYTTKKIGDEWMATWETSDLPADAEVTHVTLIPYRGERAVVGYREGVMHLPEGDIQQGETLAAAMQRIAKQQCGIAHATTQHLGHFRYVAGARNTTHAPGSVIYDALYVVDVKELEDAPEDTSYERRIILQRDLNQILRTAYVERRREYTDALDQWLLERIKAGLKTDS
jgi:ADP-ribose pyrophosphatase YjhB (NUDIX family)